jgi:hypothetical protein
MEPTHLQINQSTDRCTRTTENITKTDFSFFCWHFCWPVVSCPRWSDSFIEFRRENIGATVQPTMYGLFIEDINFAADGGCMPSW